jgi:hypothetical protein
MLPVANIFIPIANLYFILSLVIPRKAKQPGTRAGK